jgi:hypothetical protein
MAYEPRKIKVAADSELGGLVDEARRHPVLLGKDGAVYSLKPHSSDLDDLWVGCDPQKMSYLLDSDWLVNAPAEGINQAAEQT